MMFVVPVIELYAIDVATGEESHFFVNDRIGL